jgi:peroxiredoxin Q/BCP
MYADFEKKGAQIAGVSRDSVESHQRFKERFELPFPLLADTDEKLCNAFDVLVNNPIFGRMIQRSTFLFDADGTAVEVWPKVSVTGHAEDVLSKIP